MEKVPFLVSYIKKQEFKLDKLKNVAFTKPSIPPNRKVGFDSDQCSGGRPQERRIPAYIERYNFLEAGRSVAVLQLVVQEGLLLG